MKNGRIFIEVLLGNFILAIAIAVFVLPNDMICGGVTGLSIILRHFLGMEISVSVLIFNVILFIAGVIFLGRKFAITTIISTFVFPIFLALCQKLPIIDQLNENILLSCICAGLLCGVGIGIVIRNGASTGGMDIPPLVINKKTGISVSTLIYVFDTCILMMQAVFSEPMQVLYGILIVFLTSFALNKVVMSGQQQIQVFIISKKYEEIKKKLLFEMDNGVTLFNIETGFEEQQQKGIMCVTSNRKLHTINEIIQKIDQDAFTTISVINEVKGKGFSIERDVQISTNS